VEEQKCVSKVLDVFIAACSHSPKIEAVFLGDGPERKTLEARVKHARLENRIRFTGRLTPDDVRTELLKAQAISLMSDYEGLPVSLLEAMACGLVPVCRNIRSGIPQIVHHTETGLLVENDVQAAAGSLVALAEDKTAWITMSANGRALVKANYSHEECMQKWLDLIREVGKKATVRYPLPVPWFPSLPPFDQRLRKSDRRSPLWMRRIKRKIMACGAGNDT
jgi:glycosyltransferase involved in cell wall biosynthesis